LILTQMSL